MAKTLSQPVALAWLPLTGEALNQTMLVEKKAVHKCLLLVTQLQDGTTFRVTVNTHIFARLKFPDVSTSIY